MLWLAFKLVTLSYQKQLFRHINLLLSVVISFQISNFELSETARTSEVVRNGWLWLAFKLVTLSYQKQR